MERPFTWCRMKMGLLLTGVGDKVMRLWSLETYNCMEEYSIQDASPLIDFDFDERKIVGLVGTRICLWRRNGKISTFPSREGTFMKGLCMRYRSKFSYYANLSWSNTGFYIIRSVQLKFSCLLFINPL
ncbi:F-box/WD-40 repeat-containing protein At3g52030-like isoform X2 [Jatropha curcas]|uniref:F-box/WD-40 repeat-containing protein At3g52030-like isoform X2 n=1 Tax=Jatropha curcas TaxID=180498 RepID=UPI001893F177|nr:F-box/WD-40 repeat-containing protein At3g52030-like isoform X2 [Jatropha curcas]